MLNKIGIFWSAVSIGIGLHWRRHPLCAAYTCMYMYRVHSSPTTGTRPRRKDCVIRNHDGMYYIHSQCVKYVQYMYIQPELSQRCSHVKHREDKIESFKKAMEFRLQISRTAQFHVFLRYWHLIILLPRRAAWN